MHPLLRVLLDASEGRFPPADGGVGYLPPLEDGWETILSLTGHSYIASRLGESKLADLEPDGFGKALDPSVQQRMAGPGGWIGVIDVTLFARGIGGGNLQPNRQLDSHPRVAYARGRRQGVFAYGDDRGLFTLGSGLAGQREVSVEVSGDGSVRGRDLIKQALTMVAEGEALFAAVSPGNARSLRSFLSCGFIPIGSEVLIRPG